PGRSEFALGHASRFCQSRAPDLYMAHGVTRPRTRTAWHRVAAPAPGGRGDVQPRPCPAQPATGLEPDHVHGSLVRLRRRPSEAADRMAGARLPRRRPERLRGILRLVRHPGLLADGDFAVWSGLDLPRA